MKSLNNQSIQKSNNHKYLVSRTRSGKKKTKMGKNQIAATLNKYPKIKLMYPAHLAAKPKSRGGCRGPMALHRPLYIDTHIPSDRNQPIQGSQRGPLVPVHTYSKKPS